MNITITNKNQTKYTDPMQPIHRLLIADRERVQVVLCKSQDETRDTKHYTLQVYQTCPIK